MSKKLLQKQKQKIQISLVAIIGSVINNITLDGNIAQIAVKFTSEQVT